MKPLCDPLVVSRTDCPDAQPLSAVWIREVSRLDSLGGVPATIAKLATSVVQATGIVGSAGRVESIVAHGFALAGAPAAPPVPAPLAPATAPPLPPLPPAPLPPLAPALVPALPPVPAPPIPDPALPVAPPPPVAPPVPVAPPLPVVTPVP